MMAPSAIMEISPSALQDTLNSSTYDGQSGSVYLLQLASQILLDLQYQHDWTSLTIHTSSPLTSQPLSRPMLSGLPPRRAYIHPDEQIETLKAEHASGEKIEYPPEREWVLPTHLQERLSLSKFAAVFDGISVVPPGDSHVDDPKYNVSGKDAEVGAQWQGQNRQKRLLLATLHDDSTVTYYIMHDGIVKPRQN